MKPHLPSGKRLQFAIMLLNMAIQTVDLPLTFGEFPSFFVCLPEGTNKEKTGGIGDTTGLHQKLSLKTY